MFGFLVKHQHLAGGMMVIIALLMVFFAVPNTWYHT